MICPTCGTHIPDGSLRCPACHASVGVTVAMPALQGRWCPSCGAGVGWEDEVCLACGMPLEHGWRPPDPSQEPPQAPSDEDGAADTDETGTDGGSGAGALPRIESAIPAEGDMDSKVVSLEGTPRTRAFLLASLASVALVCGLAIAITHPWNPDAYSIKATREKDTSMAGFPGTVEALSGQDSNGRAPAASMSGDEATFAQLEQAYEKLDRYEERANESEARFEEALAGADPDEIVQGKREADALSIDVSNLISALGKVDVTSGVYATELDQLLSLGNWLRNRLDALCAAWEAAAGSDDPAAEREALRARVSADQGEDGKGSYQRLFEDNYEAWKPVAHD